MIKIKYYTMDFETIKQLTEKYGPTLKMLDKLENPGSYNTMPPNYSKVISKLKEAVADLFANETIELIRQERAQTSPAPQKEMTNE